MKDLLMDFVESIEDIGRKEESQEPLDGEELKTLFLFSLLEEAEQK